MKSPPRRIASEPGSRRSSPTSPATAFRACPPTATRWPATPRWAARAGSACTGRSAWAGPGATRSPRWPPRSASGTTGCRCRATCCRSRRSATPCSGTPPRSSRSCFFPRSRPAGWCSARASPSPRPAPTSRRSAPRPAATASASWCRATRSGPPAPRSPTGSTWRCERTRTRPARTAASRCSWRTCARRASRYARSPPSAAGVLCEVFLNEVEVPASQLVGELHGGWRVLMGTLDHERVTSEKVGVVLRVLDDLDAAARLGGRAPRAPPPARRGPGRAAARTPGRGAARGGPPRRGGVLDGQALDRRCSRGARRSWACACSAPRRSWSAAAALRGGGPAGGAHQGERRRHRGGRRGRDPAPRDRPPGPGVRRVSAVLETGSPAEARQFADTVAGVVARHSAPDPWHPGAAVSDAVPALDAALAEAGWDELGSDERLLPFVAPAAAALGRGFASLAPVDRLLGGALRTGALARYAHDGCAARGAARRARSSARVPGGSRRCPTPTRSGWRGWRPGARRPRARTRRRGGWRRGPRPRPATWRAWPRSRCGSRSSTRARGTRSALRSRRSSRCSRCSPTPRRWRTG